MKWIQERDLLIAQTMAFVQSVTGQKPPAEIPPEAKIRIDLRPNATAEKVVQAVARVSEVRIVPLPQMSMLPAADLRQEIKSRVALFRAHQQRFHKERDHYYVSTMAQLSASAENQAKPPQTDLSIT